MINAISGVGLMIKDAMSAILETPEGRRYFRFAILVTLSLLVLCLVSLLWITVQRGYNNAPINVWGLDIGAIPSGGSGKTEERTTDAANPDLHNVYFEWRTPDRVWETDGSCEIDLIEALKPVQLSSFKKSGELFSGEKDGALILASCYGEKAGRGSMASVVAFGKKEGAKESIDTFLAMTERR
ncbi:hypothetical protein HFO93_04455 [Rhizobium leguminosarum]|uniref:Uncharacterized protein n=2 Tax=Rhizobium TaxID=379 RepID=A0A179C2F6_RHILE|nr:hypothetical protein [Rhizobium leguminosarum]MBY5442737.1 hypothetical protein [Rhizobium leguminosarum]OAP97699.1 hypothetical protein A4U53_36210 [Rhizobium leguminosarum]